MKKSGLILTLTASVLALSACVAPFSAFASDPTTINQDSAPKSGNCEVTYTKSAPQYSYTVIIPASVNITGVPENDKCTISAEDVNLQTGYALTVSLTSENYDLDNAFHRLKLDSDETTGYIPYSIRVNGEKVLFDGNVFSRVDTNYSTEMFFELNDNGNAPAGNYSDILTFSVWCYPAN